MVSRTTCASGVLALCIAAARPAVAAPPEGRAIVDWRGPSECNDSAAVEDEVERLLAGSEPTTAPLAVSIRVTRIQARYTLVLEAPGGLRREFEADSCADLIKPAAVIIALSIDPEATSRALEAATSEPERGAEQAPPATSPMPRPEPREERPSLMDLSDEPRPRDAGIEQQTQKAPVAPYVRAGATTDFGALPALSTGPLAFAGVSFRSLRVEVGILYLPIRAATIDLDGRKGADLDLVAGALLGCVTPYAAALEFGACAGVEAGRMRGESFGIRSPATGVMDWVAARGGGLLGFRLNGQLELVARGDLIARIGRAAFLIEGLGAVHRPASVGARVDLGLELRFR